jgi:hypothetical protein
MHMHKRKTAADLNEDIKVGEGDETISDWNHGFDVVDEIDERLWELPADFEWTKIERELSSYSEFVDGLEALEGKSDLLKLFEKFPGASLCHSFYDHGSPGCSGFYLEAFVKRRHLDYVQNAFTALLKAIDSQLEQLKNLPKGQ